MSEKGLAYFGLTFPVLIAVVFDCGRDGGAGGEQGDARGPRGHGVCHCAPLGHFISPVCLVILLATFVGILL
jgi:hypothetical protein